MNQLPDRILTIAFLTILIVGTAAKAFAQQAHFHLPFDAKWGSLVLPPGDYTVQVTKPTTTATATEAIVRGPIDGFILPVSSEYFGDRTAAPPDSDFLQLVKVGDVYFVTKYQEGSQTTTLHFRTPKQPHPEQAAAREVVNIAIKRS